LRNSTIRRLLESSLDINMRSLDLYFHKF
jgi:hypothetical protein